MPVLEVEVVGPLPAGRRRGLASRVADAAARVLNSGPMHTWVRVRLLDRADYAENSGGPHRGVLPVFVTVLSKRPKRGRALSREMAALTHAVAEAVGRPAANVHVLYHPPAVGRIAFGGRLIRR